jgi:hypothetical protein
MDTNKFVAEFIGWCKAAFGFLTENYGFALVQEGHPNNRFFVLFKRTDLMVCVNGGGYGRNADISYRMISGFEIPYQCLSPDWTPRLGKKGKKQEKKEELSQEEQIFKAAEIMSKRDTDILGGDLTRLELAAKRLQTIYDNVQSTWRGSQS